MYFDKLNKKEARYFSFAKEVAANSPHNRIKIGAVIVSHGHIVSIGNNKYKSHPKQKELNKYRFGEQDTCMHHIHAELNAILHAHQYELEDATIYVYREDKKGNLANCRPCNACMKEIKEVGISTIYYTTPDGFCREILV